MPAGITAIPRTAALLFLAGFGAIAQASRPPWCLFLVPRHQSHGSCRRRRSKDDEHPPGSDLSVVIKEESPFMSSSSDAHPKGTPRKNNNTNSLRIQLGLGDCPEIPTTTASATTTLLRRRPPPLVVGHRGAIHEHLENTVAGFVQCAEWGCDAVELDVFAVRHGTRNPTKEYREEEPNDGTAVAPPPQPAIVVVFHGDDSHPSGGGGGLAGYILSSSSSNDDRRSICDLTYSEIQRLHFNPHFAEFPCPHEKIVQGRIPTLEDVLVALKPFEKTKITIELKGPSAEGANLVPAVLDIVNQLDMTHRCTYSSFDSNLLKQVRRLCPEPNRFPTGALFSSPTPVDFIARAQACGATDIHLRYDECTVERVAQAHQAGFGTMAWFRGPVGMAHDLVHVYGEMHNDAQKQVQEDTAASDNAHENFSKKTMLTENEACYRALIDTGIQSICCNKPDLLLAMLGTTVLGSTTPGTART